MNAMQKPPVLPSAEVVEDADDVDGSALLYNVVYCSRASAEMNGDAVARIVATAQRHNADQHITGMLVYGSGVFFQWLEGPRDNVLRLMARLQTDPRHHHMVELTAAEEVRERMFPTWDMERVTADDIRGVLMDALGEADDPQHQAALRLLLNELDSGQLHGLVPV